MCMHLFASIFVHFYIKTQARCVQWWGLDFAIAIHRERILIIGAFPCFRAQIFRHFFRRFGGKCENLLNLPGVFAFVLCNRQAELDEAESESFQFDY